MAKIEIKDLIARLNACCKMSLEESASLCVSNGHREVTIEHLLVQLLTVETDDIRVILQKFDVDPNVLKEQIEQVFRRFKVAETGRTPMFSPLLVDLLEDAWLLSSTKLEQKNIRSGAILVALLGDLGRYVPFDYFSHLDRLPRKQMIREFDELTAGSIEATTQQTQSKKSDPNTNPVAETALGKYGHNFTEAARRGEIDPIFCRDREIRQIVEILCRRRKNNPICVGEAGVGKTALAEGMALQIVRGDIPAALQNVELWGLDIGALQAGASVKGEFEKRLKMVIEEVKGSETPIILFIDEAHTLIGAGGNQGGSDAANLLKPALARGELKTIAATTWSEYKKYFEKDPALTRRFQLVQLDEPTVEQTVVILRGLKETYEKSHGIYISEEALEAAARLSARYITGRQLPDKAIDIIDTACARVKASASALPLPLEEINQETLSLERERAGLLRDGEVGNSDSDKLNRLERIEERLKELEARKTDLSSRFEEQKGLAQAYINQRTKILNQDEAPTDTSKDEPENAESAKSEEGTNNKSLPTLRAELLEAVGNEKLVATDVGADEIADIIADWTGIPVSSMAEDDYTKLITLGETMRDTIKGQDHAIQIIESRLQASRLDLHKQGQPLGVFLLFGPSGVGKTETALEVARKLFGSEQFMTTINMSEYQERHTISRLIGSPPGYVGFGEGGILTEAIRKKPYSVVLLDEVEKADPNVLNLFYQAFDKGELGDGEGRLIDCKNIVFFLTSNLGSDQIEEWVHTAEEGKIPSPERILESIQPILSQHFKPALLARMEPIVYMPLNEEAMAKIVEAKVASLIQNLQKVQGIELNFLQSSKDHLKSLCDVAANGARLIDQVIQRKILPSISLEILEAGQQGETIRQINVESPEDGGFMFSSTLISPEEPKN